MTAPAETAAGGVTSERIDLPGGYHFKRAHGCSGSMPLHAPNGARLAGDRGWDLVYTHVSQATFLAKVCAEIVAASDAALAVQRQAHADEVARLRADRRELTKALTNLTCGGSEFFIRKGDDYVADIPACVAWIRRAREDAIRGRIEAIKARKAAEADAAALQVENDRLRTERDAARTAREHQRTERRRNTVRGVINWLHRRADGMADPHARSLLNGTARELGIINAVDKPKAAIRPAGETGAGPDHRSVAPERRTAAPERVDGAPGAPGSSAAEGKDA